ncbi:hypothetical protein Acsp02_64360 [Actinoplanes sp. NBRC 103695]|nr:hypothetical protein Acsp02_64360 [Actinoplanes sp. NBRC 103695]
MAGSQGTSNVLSPLRAVIFPSWQPGSTWFFQSARPDRGRLRIRPSRPPSTEYQTRRSLGLTVTLGDSFAGPDAAAVIEST